MNVKAKYQSVLALGEQLQVKQGHVEEKEGVLILKGIAKSPYEKNILWDEIKRVGGQKPADIKADIRVENDSVYHFHTVLKGETLGKIAQHYFGKASKYKEIFAANRDILNNPDLIKPGQVLIIPNL